MKESKVLCSRALCCNCPDNLGPDDINNTNTACAREHLPRCRILLLGVVSLALPELPPCKDLKLLNVIEALLIPEPLYQQCLGEICLNTAIINLTSGTLYK